MVMGRTPVIASPKQHLAGTTTDDRERASLAPSIGARTRKQANKSPKDRVERHILQSTEEG